MKKLQRFIALALTVAILGVTLCSCSNVGKSIMDDTYSQYENVASSASFITQEGKTKRNFSLKGKEEEVKYVTVDMGKEVEYNTVVLGESTKTVTLYEIYGSNEQDANYKYLYQSDCIEGGHTCYLGDVNYRYLRIFVNGSSGRYNVNSFAAYNIKKDNAKSLRVNSYIVMEGVSEQTDFSMLEAVTDLIAFGTAKFDSKGNIIFVDGQGNEVDEKYYSDKLDILKKNVGDKKINLICDIAMPYGDDNLDIKSMMSDENVDNLVSSVVDFVDKYGFDGYDMDYEFPNSSGKRLIISCVSLIKQCPIKSFLLQ